MKVFQRAASLVLAIIFTVALYPAPFVSAEEVPSPPTLITSKSPVFSTMGKVDNGNEETPGEWYAGETPGNLNPHAPVLLFVPGLNSTAQVFWENNDLYQTAYNAGYQTAFVQLYDAGGQNADMWNNGQLLASKIREISNYFGGKDITIVAHSKGGVDSQTALTYYGVSSYVDNIITLSSPHHGSQLADLAYSSWASWLADLIGAQGEGTAAMQMAYMENFRMQTDSHPNAYLNDYFTLGGTEWGAAFSSNWFGGMYLSSYGPNDGVVTAASSNLPGGHELAIGAWDHSTVRTGLTFPVFAGYLAGDNLVSKASITSAAIEEITPPQTNRYVTGGPIAGKEVLAVDVEEDVQTITINLLTAEKLANFKVIDPSGKPAKKDVVITPLEEGVFKGAVSYSVSIDSPDEGEWSIEMQSSSGENAYLAITDFDTEPYLEEDNIASTQGIQEQTYQLKLDDEKLDVNSLSATYHVTESGKPQTEKRWTVGGKSNLSQRLELKNKNKVYNITIDIQGKTKEGNPFNRTIVDSVYAK
ncbi:hypothetical protein D8M04_07310 [Oceanobacillus piezotolerans]|uniref:GPI inositol-deacylase PGAP1-like alpha/beta domain-containing protein n=1 Tax=Oceanobacillus piezotolerans TaxID=2448030 RepID=A0A498DBC8_9BACI|nr:hypothetical protein [Oceanobacillus piezotolerans]RLL46994.1 hypothetical protein D8M04_07310 [Oceanobacillus piezotolerans]